jgi:hypothetical protein
MVTYYQPPCSSCETEIFLLCCVLFSLKYLSLLQAEWKVSRFRQVRWLPETESSTTLLPLSLSVKAQELFKN